MHKSHIKTNERTNVYVCNLSSISDSHFFTLFTELTSECHAMRTFHSHLHAFIFWLDDCPSCLFKNHHSTVELNLSKSKNSAKIFVSNWKCSKKI